MFISFIFPCYNEEKAIPLFLPKIIQARKNILQKTSVKDMEIIIVNDGSEDQSLKLLEKYKSEVHVISSETRKGYGSAIKKGIQASQGDWIAFCDLDDSYQARDLELLIDQAQVSSLSMVYGNRLHKKSQIQGIRSLGNQIYRLLFLLLSQSFVSDPCSGFRLFKKSLILSQLDNFPSDLSFSLAITAYCIRHKIPLLSVDISYHERAGTSKLHIFKDGFIFLGNLLKFLFF